MSEQIHIQYVGFQPRRSVREYTFRVLPSSLEPGEPREFTLTIDNEAFLSHRARYQEGPDICFQKLQRELADHPHRPLKMRFSVSDEELEQYRGAHSSKSARSR